MIVMVTQEHIDQSDRLAEKGIYRSPLHLALQGTGIRIVNHTYDQKTTDRVIVTTLAEDGTSHKLAWLASVAGGASPQAYLLDWDFSGTAVPAEFEFIQ